MIRYTRPEPPPDWEKRVAQVRDRIQEMVELGCCPKSTDFEPRWQHRKIKKCFQRAQHCKCGYCEQPLTDTGAIEHFAPKAGVTALGNAPATWGAEEPGCNLVTGRQTPPVPGCEVGYWWRAYDWNNDLLACFSPPGRVAPPALGAFPLDTTGR